VAGREAGVRWLSAIGEFVPLRDEPRFKALCRTLGIGA
jgi:hypothetical protein